VGGMPTRWSRNDAHSIARSADLHSHPALSRCIRSALMIGRSRRGVNKRCNTAVLLPLLSRSSQAAPVAHMPDAWHAGTHLYYFNGAELSGTSSGSTYSPDSARRACSSR
jgi:hypothetical protein